MPMDARQRIVKRPRHSDRQTRRLLRGLLALYDHLHTPLPLAELLQAIVETAVRYVPGAQRGSLILFDGDVGIYAAAVGYDLHALHQIRLPYALIAAQFTGHRTTQLARLSSLDTPYLDPTTLALLHEHGLIDQIQHALITKISVGNTWYGTLSLDNVHTHTPFSSSALALAQIFAEQAGTLIDQALLVESLRETNTRLIEAEQLATLGSLISSIAHQLNNPLTAIYGYSELLAAETLAPDHQSMVEQIANAAGQMRNNVRALQLFARQQRGGPAQLNLNLLIEQIVTLKQRDMIVDEIGLSLVLDPDLPLIWADGGQLSQVLLHLIQNAQQALRDQPLPRRITISTTLTTHNDALAVQICLNDNGPGLPAAVSASLDSPPPHQPRVHSKLGRGLMLSQRILADHGGRLWSSVSPLGGASLYMQIPLKPGVD